MQKVPVSVLIPTKNEERNLPSTLDALDWADQIIVFDSYSTDGTVELAKARGAEVHQRVFDNFSDHKNWALRNLAFRHDWILLLDADEKATPALAEEIRRIIAGETDKAGYYVARQIWVDGVWLKHAGKYPDYQLRFFKKGMASYEKRLVHEHMVVAGPVGFLKNHIVHIDEKGTHRYIERHDRFAEMEAVEAVITIRKATQRRDDRAALRGQPVERRRRLKIYAYRFLPARPLLVFVYLYVCKLGFLMGKAGLKTCALRMFYEYMIDLYIEELADPGSPVAVKYRDYIEKSCAAATSEI